MKLTCHPDIDGLRAIAVDIITICHTQISILAHQPFEGGLID